jgi:solute carrier family 25, member 39/40
MLTYDQLQNNVLPQLLPSIPTSILPLFAGITARTSITSVMTPLELVRTNLQSTPFHADTPHTLRSVLGSMRDAVRQQGPLYLWRGLGASLWRDVPFSGIYWAGYEAWKRTWASYGYTGAVASFLSGAISGTTAALLTSPFDTLKTRKQALIMTAAGDGSRTATMPLLAEIVRTEGSSALFAGLIPRIAKIAPACGIMIACYEVWDIDFYALRNILSFFSSLLVHRESVDY